MLQCFRKQSLSPLFLPRERRAGLYLSSTGVASKELQLGLWSSWGRTALAGTESPKEKINFLVLKVIDFVIFLLQKEFHFWQCYTWGSPSEGNTNIWFQGTGGLHEWCGLYLQFWECWLIGWCHRSPPRRSLFVLPDFSVHSLPPFSRQAVRPWSLLLPGMTEASSVEGLSSI